MSIFLTVLEATESKIKVLTNVTPSESFLPGLQAAIFLLCLYKAKSTSSRLSFYRDTNPNMGFHP